MSNPDNPGPRRKGRAGMVVVGIVLAMVVAIFVGMNLQHTQETEEGPPDESAQPGAPPAN